MNPIQIGGSVCESRSSWQKNRAMHLWFQTLLEYHIHVGGLSMIEKVDNYGRSCSVCEFVLKGLDPSIHAECKREKRSGNADGIY
jgi:hypothetical protein